MRPSAHILISCTLSWICFILTDSLMVALLAAVTGVLVDADHLVDYLLFNGRLDKGSFRKLLSGGHFQESRKLYLPLHSYELLMPIWIFASIFNAFLIAMWISISFVIHLVLDQAAYAPRALTYFGIYRAINSFDLTFLNPASLIGQSPNQMSIGIAIIGPLAPIRPQRMTLDVVNCRPSVL